MQEYQELLAVMQDMDEPLAQMKYRQKMTDDTVSAVIDGMKTFGRVLNTIWPNVGGAAGPRQPMQLPFAMPAPSLPLLPIYDIRTLSPEQSEPSRPPTPIQDIRNDLPSSPPELSELFRPATPLQDAVDGILTSPTPRGLSLPSGRPLVRGLIRYTTPSDPEYGWPSPFLLGQRVLPNDGPSASQVTMFGTIPPASPFLHSRSLSSVEPAPMLPGRALSPASVPSDGKDAQAPSQPGQPERHALVDSVPLWAPLEATLVLGQMTGDRLPPSQPRLPTSAIYALLDYGDGSDVDGMEGIE